MREYPPIDSDRVRTASSRHPPGIDSSDPRLAHLSPASRPDIRKASRSLVGAQTYRYPSISKVLLSCSAAGSRDAVLRPPDSVLREKIGSTPQHAIEGLSIERPMMALHS